MLQDQGPPCALQSGPRGGTDELRNGDLETTSCYFQLHCVLASIQVIRYQLSPNASCTGLPAILLNVTAPAAPECQLESADTSEAD